MKKWMEGYVEVDDEGDEERVAKERCKEYILGRIVFGFT